MIKASLTANNIDNPYTCKQSFVQAFWPRRNVNNQRIVHSFHNFLTSPSDEDFDTNLGLFCEALNCPKPKYSKNSRTITTTIEENPWAIKTPLNLHHFILLIRWSMNGFKTVMEINSCDSAEVFKQQKLLLKAFDEKFELPVGFYDHYSQEFYYRFSFGAMSPQPCSAILVQIHKQFPQQ